jgi:hypothetical protein
VTLFVRRGVRKDYSAYLHGYATYLALSIDSATREQIAGRPTGQIYAGSCK